MPLRREIARDAGKRFRFTSAQGPLGQALYSDLGLDTANFETNLLVVDGVVYGKLRGLIEILMRLGGIWRTAAVLRVLPARLGDWLYDRVATNRYRLFGVRETCWLPSPDLADRVI